jgi:hypothetical protein
MKKLWAALAAAATVRLSILLAHAGQDDQARHLKNSREE